MMNQQWQHNEFTWTAGQQYSATCDPASFATSYDDTASTCGTATPPPFACLDGLSSVNSVDSEEHEHRAAAGQELMMSPPPSSLPQLTAGSCVSCGRAITHGRGLTCSRRCEWFAECRCTQCGRPRRPDLPFCSMSCASQAAHANWCVACGVTQAPPGVPFCSLACANSPAAANIGSVQPRRRQMGQSNQRRAHTIAQSDDNVTQQLRSTFEKALNAADRRLIAIVKLGTDADRKRQYLAYRQCVEKQISGTKGGKYGFGGEGNEHKRYMHLNVACGLGSGSCTPGSAVSVCRNPYCEACRVVGDGFSLARVGGQSHYSVSTPAAAVTWAQNAVPSVEGAEPASRPVQAIIATRVVVGAPLVVKTCDEIRMPSMDAKGEPEFNSVIVSDGVEANDGTYVFDDVALDPQFLVLFA